MCIYDHNNINFTLLLLHESLVQKQALLKIMHFDVIISYHESFPPQVEGVPRLSCRAVVGRSLSSVRGNDSWWTGLSKMINQSWKINACILAARIISYN